MPGLRPRTLPAMTNIVSAHTQGWRHTAPVFRMHWVALMYEVLAGVMYVSLMSAHYRKTLSHALQ